MPNLTISQLFYYPLKSAAGIAVNALQFDRRGPCHDRQWMVVDQTGKFVTQRKFPKMCLIVPLVHNNTLTLTAPDMPRLQVGRTVLSVPVTVWGDCVSALDCGNDAAEWLSEYLGKSLRLVEMPDDAQRLVDTKYARDQETVGFADGYPVLLLSQASLDEFNRALDAPIDMRRFRPNIVVDGCAPYAEDDWRQLSIGSISLSLVKPCARCIIPSIDPSSGEKQMQVNAALLSTRRRDGEIYFGQNAIHQGEGSVQIGQTVEVLVR